MIPTHSVNTLPLAYWWVRKDQRECDVLSYPTFPFSSMSSISVKELAQVKEFCGHSCFLECHCLLYAFDASSGSNGKCGLSRLLAALLSLSDRPNMLLTLYLLYTLYHLTPMHWGSTGILCSWSQNTSSKIKLLGIFKWWKQSIKLRIPKTFLNWILIFSHLKDRFKLRE